jgi:hypothetical protein
VDSIQCPTGRFSVSPNNKYVLTILNDRFHLYDVTTGQDVSVLISKYLPVSSVNEFVVSDIGTMAVVNDFDDLRLIDVVHDQLLGTLTFTNGTYNLCQISSTGEYVYVFTEYKNRVYRFSGGSFTEVFNINDTEFCSLSFMADQPAKILLSLTGGMKIFNLVTGITEFTAPSVPLFLEYHVDYNDYLVLIQDDDFIKIYDINSGAVVASVVHNIDYANPHYNYLHGHTLFNGIGRWMTVQGRR